MVKPSEAFKAISFIIIFTLLASLNIPVYAEKTVNIPIESDEPSDGKMANDKHWVYSELTDFKQRINPCMGYQGTYSLFSEDEIEIIHKFVLNEDCLDKPINTRHWAVLLNAVLKLPDTEMEKLLDLYVYNFADGDEIAREDAVGGMVKLLSVKPFINASGTMEELEPAKALRDLPDISERHDILVRIAYCNGLLDSNTFEFFRPRDKLTYAEAISMLYRVITKYDITFDQIDKNELQEPPVPTDEKAQSVWIDKELQSYRDKLQNKLVKLKTAESILLDGRAGDDESLIYMPVTMEKWSETLKHVLEIDDEKVLQSYTYDLTMDKTVPRDIAVAGMLKLLHYKGIIEGRDASEKELSEAAAYFSDFNGAFDISKLAIAYNEGLVRGYPDRTFRPNQALTNGEALMLMLNVIDKCIGK